MRPSDRFRAANIPIRNEPVILITKIPQGKEVSVRGINPATQNRHKLPSAPPIATHRYASIKFHRKHIHWQESSALDIRRFSRRRGMANPIAERDY
jgi:hypothetical protein